MHKPVLVKFLALLILLLTVHIIILKLLDKKYTWGNRAIKEKMTDLKLNHPQCNTLFVGTSKTYRGIIPSLFDSLASPDVKSYNMGIAGMLPAEAYSLIEHILNEGTLELKYILVEANGVQLRRNLAGIPRGKYFLNPGNYFFAMDALLHSRLNLRGRAVSLAHFTRNFLERQSLYGLLHEYRHNEVHFDSARLLPYSYHDRGFLSYEKEFEVTEKDNQLRLGRKRDSMLNDTTVIRKKLAISFATTDAAPNLVHLERINVLIRKAEEKGVKMIFYNMQQQKVYRNHEEVLATVQQIDPAHKIDLSNSDLYPDLYSAKNLYNAEHLNEKGARIFTTLLAEAFNQLTN